MARLASNILVAGLVRLAEQRGGSVTVERRGSPFSGAVFLSFFDPGKNLYTLYEPAIQAALKNREQSGEQRYFSLKAADIDRPQLIEMMEAEARFDPDFWLVEIERLSIDQISEVAPLV